MRDYAIFDLETTGLDPLVDRITELGWLVVRDGVPSEPQSLLVWDGRPVPDLVAEKTGITTGMIASGGVAAGSALACFFTAVGELPLVGHNVIRFDSRFLEAACRRCELEPPHVDRYVDTAALFKARALGWERRPEENHARFAFRVLEQRSRTKYNLTVCCETLGIDRTGIIQHRAAADVILTHRVYEALIAERAADPR